jgi:hypothetical protein
MFNLEQNLTDYQNRTLQEKAKESIDNCGCFVFNIVYEAVEIIYPKLTNYVNNKGRGI